MWIHLDVFVLRETRGHAGQNVVVQVNLTQVRHISERAVLHHADLVVA